METQPVVVKEEPDLAIIKTEMLYFECEETEPQVQPTYMSSYLPTYSGDIVESGLVEIHSADSTSCIGDQSRPHSSTQENVSAYSNVTNKNILTLKSGQTAINAAADNIDGRNKISPSAKTRPTPVKIRVKPEPESTITSATSHTGTKMYCAIECTIKREMYDDFELKIQDCGPFLYNCEAFCCECLTLFQSKDSFVSHNKRVHLHLDEKQFDDAFWIDTDKREESNSHKPKSTIKKAMLPESIKLNSKYAKNNAADTDIDIHNLDVESEVSNQNIVKNKELDASKDDFLDIITYDWNAESRSTKQKLAKNKELDVADDDEDISWNIDTDESDAESDSPTLISIKNKEPTASVDKFLDIISHDCDAESRSTKPKNDDEDATWNIDTEEWDEESDDPDSKPVKKKKTDAVTNRPRKFKCHLCASRFKEKHNLHRHYKSNHNLDRRAPKPNSLDGKFKCGLCSSRYKSKQNLFRHYRINHKDYNTQLLSESSEKVFECKICQTSYTNIYYFNQHNKTCHDKQITNNNNYKCDLCSTTYKYEFYLNRHYKFRHNKHYKNNSQNTSAGKFQCSECSASYKRKCHLNRHYRINHVEG